MSEGGGGMSSNARGGGSRSSNPRGRGGGGRRTPNARGRGGGRRSANASGGGRRSSNARGGGKMSSNARGGGRKSSKSNVELGGMQVVTDTRGQDIQPQRAYGGVLIVTAGDPELTYVVMEDQEGTVGFHRDLEPDRILGATIVKGKLMYVMMWKEAVPADLVPASEANIKCPQVVIRFLEKHMTLAPPASDG